MTAPLPMRLGAPARDGVMLIMSETVPATGMTATSTASISALDGNGKEIWRRSFDPAIGVSAAGEAGVYAGYLGSWWVLNALPGKADDLLVSLIDVASLPVSHAVRSQHAVLDGGDGTLVRHPGVYVGLEWFSEGMAVKDLDGDALDDYVVVHDTGETSSLIGVRGLDGGELWTSDDHRFNHFAWAMALPDLDDDETSDLHVWSMRGNSFKGESSVVSGKDGATLTTHKGMVLHSPGDVDQDGEPDVLFFVLGLSRRRNTMSLDTTRIDGASIWSGDYVSEWNSRRLDCEDGCGIGIGVGIRGAGDLDRDGVDDLLINNYQETQEGKEALEVQFDSYVVEGAEGQERFRDDAWLFPGGIQESPGPDLLRVNSSRTAVGVNALGGDDGRELWSRELQLGTRLQRLPWVDVTTTDWVTKWGRPCTRTFVTILTNKSALVVALDNHGGNLWDRQVGEKMRLAGLQASSFHACNERPFVPPPPEPR